MSNQTFFTKNIRLCLATTLVASSFGVLANALLPPNAMGFAPGWNCQADFNNNWMCRSQNISHNPGVMYPQMNGYYSSPPMMAPVAPPQPYMMMPPRPSVAYPNVMTHNPPMQDQSSFAAEQAVYTEIIRSAPGSYVLQWQAANTRESLEQLRNAHNVLAETVIVEYYRLGKHWFVLLEGPFNNRREAMEALKHSPRSRLAGDLFPWTRSVASMHRLKMRYASTSNRINNSYGYNNQGYQRQNRTNTSDPRNNFYGGALQNTSDGYQRSGRYEEPKDKEYPAGYDFSTSSRKAVTEQIETIDKFSEYFKDAYAVDNVESQSGGRDKKQWQVDTLEGNSDSWNSYQEVPAMAYGNNFQEKPLNNRRYSDVTKVNSRSLLRNNRGGLLRHGSGYIIQWQAANNENSLKRIQKRYPELGRTHIVHYRKHDRDWFVLVSDPYQNRDQANNFLMDSTIAAVSTRLYPRVKNLTGLQQLLGYMKPTQKNMKPQNNQQISQVFGRSGDYTIQWYATDHLETIHQMKRKFPELATAVTVRLRRNNKNWYVLVQGEYGNNKDALMALSSPRLREVAQQLRPWTRSIKSIKIQKYRDS